MPGIFDRLRDEENDRLHDIQEDEHAYDSKSPEERDQFRAKLTEQIEQSERRQKRLDMVVNADRTRFPAMITKLQVIGACSNSTRTVVVEQNGVVAVGMRHDDIVMPSQAMTLTAFVKENYEEWVIIPDEGFPVCYGPWQREGGIFALPMVSREWEHLHPNLRSYIATQALMHLRDVPAIPE